MSVGSRAGRAHTERRHGQGDEDAEPQSSTERIGRRSTPATIASQPVRLVGRAASDRRQGPDPPAIDPVAEQRKQCGQHRHRGGTATARRGSSLRATEENVGVAGEEHARHGDHA